MQQKTEHFIHEHAATLAPLFVSFAKTESKHAPSSSALIGSSQEFTLFEARERFLAVVDQTNTRNMDLRMECRLTVTRASLPSNRNFTRRRVNACFRDRKI